MDSRLRLTVALLALASCTAAQRAERARESIGEPPHDVLEGKYTVVRCYFDNLPACREAAAIAESAYEQSCRFLGLTPELPPHPLEIELVASSRDLTSVNRELNVRPMKGRKGFTTTESESIYLECDSCAPQRALPSGLLGWDRASIAHEVLHLTNALRIGNAIYEMPWITEGEATEFEELFMRGRGAMPDVAECSEEAFRMDAAQKLLAAGKLPHVEDIVATPLEDLATPSRYAVWWLFYSYLDLGPHQQRFRQFMRWVQDGSIRDPRQVAVMFGDAFDAGQLDGELAAYVRAQRPAWAGGAMDTLGDGWAQIAGRRGAWAWRTPGHDPNAMQGEVTRVHGLGQVMMLFGSPKQTCFGVDLIDRGRIAIIKPPEVPPPPSARLRTPWPTLASAPVTMPLSGEPVPFQIDVTGGKIVLREAGRTLIAEAPTCAPSSSWAFFSGSRTTSLWKRVRFVEPFAAPWSLTPTDAGPSPADGGLDEITPPGDDGSVSDGGEGPDGGAADHHITT